MVNRTNTKLRQDAYHIILLEIHSCLAYSDSESFGHPFDMACGILVLRLDIEPIPCIASAESNHWTIREVFKTKSFERGSRRWREE